MDTSTARELIELNNRFYRDNARSFSQTRQAPWLGWQRVAECVRETLPSEALHGGRPMHVLDLACGNMRLAAFLAQEFPDARIVYTGIDASKNLAGLAHDELRDPNSPDVRFVACDVLDRLLQGQPMLAPTPLVAGYDLICCFGFLHHVPSVDLRRALIRELCGLGRDGGVIAISFWQFMHDERLAEKARQTTMWAKDRPPFPQYDVSRLEHGDYLLGWQNANNGYRYCHSFEEPELDKLAATAVSEGVSEIARFSADGKGNALNRYLLFETPGKQPT